MTGYTNLVRCLRDRAERYGDGRWFAYVTSRGGELVETDRLGYARLDERARALGTWIAGEGSAGRPVLLLYPAGPEFLCAFFGCLYAGAIAVPAPLPGTDAHALERAEGMIADCGGRMVLTDAANLPGLRERLGRSGPDERVRCVATDGGDLRGSGRLPDAAPSDVAYLQYTSGSTGRPRGVAISHGNVLANCAAIGSWVGAPAARTAAGWLPHFHDMGLVGMLHTLFAGGDLVCAPPVAFLARPALWLEMIDRYRAGTTVAPDSGYEWLARRCRDEKLAGLDVSCLRRAVIGAEPVRPSTLEAVERRFAAIGWDRRVWAPAYGLAEATLLVAGSPGGGPVVRRPGTDPGSAGTSAGIVAAGRPVGARVRVVDPRTRVPLDDGRVGEIWVAGDGVALGYHGDAEATERTFRTRLRDGEGPYLRTGDLGYVEDGLLHVTGRLKEVVIVNGRNLYPHDLEEAGRRAHPAAGAGAAFAVAGGDREHVVLVQEVDRRRAEPLDALARSVRHAVSAAAGVPVSVVLVRRNAIARTTSGKVRRHRTRRRWLDGRLTVLHADLEPDAGLAVSAVRS
ncbi:fatty acyl-AMP ligase [Actinomadura sp. WMMB 499]|uniref:fatty acyl-AMP ligase n=1 Tax=Actinomadura sp. WMMB 499 TaxID=1219491 RepID=UPI0012458BF2|nr:fatty acyl-AMP ligase [Actinomadura sp. WMMB 499]QFG20199.1 fatty acyl-AMP ligase [Actinomadura sp. WMMB 499]